MLKSVFQEHLVDEMNRKNIQQIVVVTTVNFKTEMSKPPLTA